MREVTRKGPPLEVFWTGTRRSLGLGKQNLRFRRHWLFWREDASVHADHECCKSCNPNWSPATISFILLLL